MITAHAYDAFAITWVQDLVEANRPKARAAACGASPDRARNTSASKGRPLAAISSAIAANMHLQLDCKCILATMADEMAAKGLPLLAEVLRARSGDAPQSAARAFGRFASTESWAHVIANASGACAVITWQVEPALALGPYVNELMAKGIYGVPRKTTMPTSLTEKPLVATVPVAFAYLGTDGICPRPLRPMSLMAVGQGP